MSDESGQTLRNRVFISYRRGSESRAVAGHLVTHLEHHYHRGVAYLDARATGGERFDREIELAIARSEVVIAVVGPDWFHPHDPNRPDWVIEELRHAKRHDVPIMTVGIAGETHIRSEWLQRLPPELQAELEGVDLIKATAITHDFEDEAYKRILEKVDPELPRRARRMFRYGLVAMSVVAAGAFAGGVVGVDRYDKLCEAYVIRHLDPCELGDLAEASGRPLILPYQPSDGTPERTADRRSGEVLNALGSGAVLARRGYPRAATNLSTEQLARVLDDTRRDGVAAQVVVTGMVEHNDSLDRLRTEIYMGELYLAAEVAQLSFELSPISLPTSSTIGPDDDLPPELTAGLAPLTDLLAALPAYERNDPDAIEPLERVIRGQPPPELQALAHHLLGNLNARIDQIEDASFHYDQALSLATISGADMIAERARFGSIEALLLAGVRAADREQPICTPETEDLLRQSVARFGSLATDSAASPNAATTFTPFKAHVGIARAHYSLAQCELSTFTAARDATLDAIEMVDVDIDAPELRDEEWPGADDLPQHAKGAISFALATRGRAALQEAIQDGDVGLPLDDVLTDLQAAASASLTFDPSLQLEILLEVLDTEFRYATDAAWSVEHGTRRRAQNAFQVWSMLDTALDCDDQLDELLQRHLASTCAEVEG